MRATRRRERRRRVGRRRPRPRRGRAPRLDPAGQGHPHHGAVGEGAQRHRRRHPGARRTSAACSSCRGATSPTSAPPTPTTTARSTTRSARRTTSPTCCGRSTASVTTGVTEADVIGTWAGLRPLVKSAAVGPHRRPVPPAHRCAVSPSGVVSVTGGKLTTYRRMAADTVDAVMDRLGPHGALEPHEAPPPPRRRRLRRAEPGPTRPPTCAGRYGTLAADVEALIDADPALAEPLVPGLPYLAAEAVYAARHEMAAHARRRPLPPHPGPPARPRRHRRGGAGGRRAARRRSWAGTTTRRPGRWRPTGVDRARARQRPTSPSRRSTPLRGLSVTVAHPAHRLAGAPAAVDAAVGRRSADRRRSRRRAALGLPGHGDRSGHAGPRPAGTGGRWPCTGRWPARSAALAAVRVPAGRRRPRWPPCSASATSARMPVTAAGGRSGVCGASVPVHGGVVLDLTAMAGIVAVDDESLTVDVLAGTFGHDLEADLRAARAHPRPLAPVDGPLDRRRLARLPRRRASTRPATARSRTWSSASTSCSPTAGRSPPAARRGSAVGPDLTQLFVGSEGTLGVITGARLRVHPLPPAERRAAYGFASFDAGLDACRRILRRGATPAVLRLYDEAESQRVARHRRLDRRPARARRGRGPRWSTPRWRSSPRSAPTRRALDDALVERWLEHRNDVARARGAHPARASSSTRMEIAGPVGPARRRSTAGHRGAAGRAPRPGRPSAHLSHSYRDGACLYFTFAATPPPDEVEATYVALWDAGTRAVLGAGGTLSHHHGVGLNRARFVGRGARRRLRRARAPSRRRSIPPAS